MPTRYTLLLVAFTTLMVPLLCPIASASASAVFLPRQSPSALKDFAEAFALPVMNSNAELRLHTVVLALLPLATAAAAADSQPALHELGSRCLVDVNHAQQQSNRHHVAMCSWPASDASSHFVALQSSEHQSPPNTSAAFVVFGSSIKHIRESLTWLMRHLLLHWHAASSSLGWMASPSPLDPWTSLRSTQLARSMVTMPMQHLQQYIKELAVFGLSTLEMVHDLSFVQHGACADAAPLGELSRFLVTLDIELSLYFPLDSFVDPAGKACTDLLMKSLARCDAVFVPGGDGSTPLHPADLFALTQQLRAVVHAVHNDTKFYVSLQQYSSRNMSEAWAILGQETYKGVINGVVYGPHTDVSLKDFVAAAPDAYDVRIYPDVCHTIYCQYELPAWHEAFAFTHSRQAVNPSPVMFANIYNTYVADDAVRSRLIGVSSYSEGLAADLNMCILLALASHNCTADDAVLLYASFFFGAGSAANVTKLMFLFEKSWTGDIYNNSAIASAYDLATTTLQSKLGWRAQMYLYRATYDAAVRHRVLFDADIKAYGLDALGDWPQAGPDWCIVNFMGALEIQDPDQGDLDDMISALSELREALNASIGLAVLQSQQPSLSLEDIKSTAISDNTFLHAAANTALHKSETAQVAFIASVLNHTHCPLLPCNYDWLGGIDPRDHPHLVPGPGPSADPDFFKSPLRSFSNQPESQVAAQPERWRTYAEIFYDNRLVVAYPPASLKVGVDHTLVVVFFSTASDSTVCCSMNRLVLNNVTELMPFTRPAFPMRPLTFVIPAAATTLIDGVSITCEQEQGVAGSGRGCHISEMFLYPAP